MMVTLWAILCTSLCTEHVTYKIFFFIYVSTGDTAATTTDYKRIHANKLYCYTLGYTQYTTKNMKFMSVSVYMCVLCVMYSLYSKVLYNWMYYIMNWLRTLLYICRA